MAFLYGYLFVFCFRILYEGSYVGLISVGVYHNCVFVLLGFVHFNCHTASPPITSRRHTNASHYTRAS